MDLNSLGSGFAFDLRSGFILTICNQKYNDVIFATCLRFTESNKYHQCFQIVVRFDIVATSSTAICNDPAIVRTHLQLTMKSI